jgi:hypothetical protein
MNALELIDKLKTSGTGESKIKALTKLATAEMSAEELIALMPDAHMPSGTIIKAEAFAAGKEPPADVYTINRGEGPKVEMPKPQAQAQTEPQASEGQVWTSPTKPEQSHEPSKPANPGKGRGKSKPANPGK